MRSKNSGFTLIETLISLILISFSTIFILKCSIISLNGIKNSNLRFKIGQLLENKKNLFLGEQFESPLLSAGKRTESLKGIFIRIKIDDVTPSLKKIILEGSGNNFKTALVFYRSEIVKEAIYD